MREVRTQNRRTLKKGQGCNIHKWLIKRQARGQEAGAKGTGDGGNCARGRQNRKEARKIAKLFKLAVSAVVLRAHRTVSDREI